MEKLKGDYSEAEIASFRKYIRKYPNTDYWTTEDGIQIPFKFLKDNHLDNVIRRIELRLRSLGKGSNIFHPRGFDALTRLREEKKMRVIKKSTAGRILFGE